MKTLKQIEKVDMKLKKVTSEIMRALGFIMLSALVMIGTIVFYLQTEDNLIKVIVLSTTTIILLYAMTQVKDVW